MELIQTNFQLDFFSLEKLSDIFVTVEKYYLFKAYNIYTANSFK